MKLKIYKFSKVTSTNDMAIKLIKKKSKQSGCIYAGVQTKGRGSKGRQWISKKGNLFSSIFFSLKKNYPPFHEFTIINPVLVSAVINKFCSIKKINFKFPNDILINNKKVCGILQETVQKKGIKYLIVGIGLNLVKSPNIQGYPTTNLYELTKAKINVNKATKQLMLIYNNFLKSKKVF